MPFTQELPADHPLNSGDDMFDADSESLKPVSREDVAVSLGMSPASTWGEIKAHVNELAIKAGEKEAPGKGHSNKPKADA
jgi:hypothetical protein